MKLFSLRTIQKNGSIATMFVLKFGRENGFDIERSSALQGKRVLESKLWPVGSYTNSSNEVLLDTHFTWSYPVEEGQEDVQREQYIWNGQYILKEGISWTESVENLAVACRNLRSFKSYRLGYIPIPWRKVNLVPIWNVSQYDQGFQNNKFLIFHAQDDGKTNRWGIQKSL